MARPRTPESGPIVLVQRRVYILPTRHGMIFAVVLLMMLLGSINYGLSLGFVLTFLLVALAVNGMLHTFRNLAHLSVSAVRTPAVFVGESAQFTLHLTNPGILTRHAVGIARDRYAHAVEDCTDIPAGGSAHLSVRVVADRRGRLPAGRLTLSTQFPLGLYFAWGYVHLDASCIVYPRPAPPGLPLPPSEATGGEGAPQGVGHDDFSGLRTYHAGDPPRHIAWKAAARGQGLLTKQFSGQAAGEVWLAWNLLPPRMGIEEKIACLTRWVLDAHALRMAYGLRLPRLAVPMASGDAQRERCLEALALYDTPETSAAPPS